MSRPQDSRHAHAALAGAVELPSHYKLEYASFAARSLAFFLQFLRRVPLIARWIKGTYHHGCDFLLGCSRHPTSCSYGEVRRILRPRRTNLPRPGRKAILCEATTRLSGLVVTGHFE
jgi:hypothetical protein